MTDDQNQGAKKWIDDAEEALNRTAEALKSAWNETREARMSTLEAAKDAATRLGKAIDLGIEAARQSWDPSSGQQEETTPPETSESQDRDEASSTE
ncbi:MAG TPA: hypothetical protein VF115_15125, partial [Acidimicrobiia bacterium]